MDWKSKFNTVFFVLIIGLVSVSAYTATFSNEADALIALGKNANLVVEKCEVIDVTKTIDFNKENEAVTLAYFELTYFVDGKRYIDDDTIELNTIDLKQNKIQIAKACDILWKDIELKNGKRIDRAIVDYTKGVLSALTKDFYDPVKKTWFLKENG